MTVNTILTKVNNFTSALFRRDTYSLLTITIKNFALKIVDNAKHLINVVKNKLINIILGPEPNPRIHRKGIPIGRYRNYKNFVYPFKNEYDALPEHAKKVLTRENSLFLSDKLDRKSKIDLMKNADFIGDASKLEEKKEDGSPRFIGNWSGISQPVLDSLHNVFYKPGKHTNIDKTAALLRYHMKKLKIDNIILPKREFWATRNECILNRLKQQTRIIEDGSALITHLMLEEHIEGLLPAAECEKMYNTNPPEVFKDMIVSISRIFCFVEIGDLDSERQDAMREPLRTVIHLRNKSGKYIVETDNPDFQSQCRFGNLPMKLDKNSKGESCMKLVFVDLDSVRKPDHTTVEKLLRMFPKHQQLIVDTIQETNPALFEGYEPNAKFKRDTFIYPEDTISTESELILNYRKNKGKPEVEDVLWTKLSEILSKVADKSMKYFEEANEDLKKDTSDEIK